MGRLDFEDMLGLTLRLFDEHPDAVHDVRSRFHAFTVDEFQDVNPLQVALLDRWLGERDDLCVVGDDYQTIYAFTGASPEHLLGFTRRFPHARVVRLEENFRSSPEVLDVANRLAPRLGGFRKTLRRRGRRGPRRSRAPSPTRKPRSAPSSRLSGVCGTRRPCRSRRSRCCTGSTPGPSRSRRLSLTPASHTGCATARSSGDRDRAGCSSG
jgi:hypothetical protein